MNKLTNRIRQIEVVIRQNLYAFVNSFKPTTYSIVKYQGDKFYIKSSLSGHNIWDLYPIDKDKTIGKFWAINPQTGAIHRIHGSQLVHVMSWRKFKEDFKSHLQHQKSSWRLIDNRKPIGTRLSYINSENIKF